uniref:CRISPR-associated helicase Cas3 n=1 Tax=Desulfobacca acetoxidans TaxID=60893 RepID=A0A7V4LDL9_9BACT
MDKPVLLAKTPEDFPARIKPAETLVGHTTQVLRAAQKIIAVLKNSSVAVPGKNFEVLALLGTIFHDLGKATNLFQGMLRHEKEFINKTHPVRHEILSALLITQFDNPIKRWAQQAFEGYGENFLIMLSWVAGGHHLKLHKGRADSRNESDRLVRVQGTPKEFIFYGAHPEVTAILTLAADFAFQFKDPPYMENMIIPQEEDDNLQVKNLRIMVEDYILQSEKAPAQLTEEEKLSLAWAKSVVIAADVAGSALLSEAVDPFTWIENALQQTLNPEELEKVIQNKITGRDLFDFQRKVAQSSAPVTLTIAGCGTGKTVAAYAWAKCHAKGKKLFFCYPTTGTASAGFEDYLLAQDSLERALLHSRAQVDLERMLGTQEQDLWEENQRLLSLKAWPQQVIACTVDTVLGLLQNQRRALFSFPALAAGAFVFDEIHNYDAKLFGALIRFITTFAGVPTLLMSASLPSHRLQLLQEVLGECLGEIIKGDNRLETSNRYRLRWLPEPDDCWQEVKNYLEDQRKVLWVCNTVADAVAIYDQALSLTSSVQPLLYHSRFRYRDRVEIQEKVLRQFRHSGPTLVISTQVCEMSLDIDADILVTALAPFPALIQRLGRLNRRGHKDPAPCLIYDFSGPENRPYASRELIWARQALTGLFDQPLSQRRLAQALEAIPLSENIKTYSAWLDGVWESDQRPLREGEAAITVILEQDLPQIKEELHRRGLKPNCPNLAPWTVPMYFHRELRLAQLFGGYPVAGDNIIQYDPLRGARWRKSSWEII